MGKKYRLENISKKKSENVCMEIADNAFARARGLMFREKIVPILFIFDKEGIYPIHSNFVKDEFDAIYLSQNKRVNEIFRKIPQNTARVAPKKKARYLLELPCDLTDELGIEENDVISWVMI